jgi:hypothetical protein
METKAIIRRIHSKNKGKFLLRLDKIAEHVENARCFMDEIAVDRLHRGCTTPDGTLIGSY